MDYKIACTNCGESNYHLLNDLSFITGRSGFHVCNNCGFQASQFPKIAKVEIEMLRKRFSRKPHHFFKEDHGSSSLYFIVIILAIVLALGLFASFY